MDRYVKTMLTIIAACTLTLALESLTPPLPVAHAETESAPVQCVWTYITDNGAPSLGKDGNVKLKGKNWKRLSEEGWNLKAALYTGGPFLYMFEKCE